MKLNIDCMREILLVVEDHQQVDQSSLLTPLTVTDIGDLLLHTSYPSQDLFYSVKQLVDGFFLEAKTQIIGHRQDYLVLDITPAGHDFLENIRSPRSWLEVKRICAASGSYSLGVIAAVSQTVALHAAQKYITNYNPYPNI